MDWSVRPQRRLRAGFGLRARKSVGDLYSWQISGGQVEQISETCVRTGCMVFDQKQSANG
jgi:hypothetical protein